MAARSVAPRRSAATESKKQRDSGGSLLRFVLAVAIVAWVFRSLIIAPFNIPSGSMLPALYIGDYIAVAKWPYGYSRYSLPFGFPRLDDRILANLPKRGDVVVFRHPTEDADLIKRVIGLPGDTVELRGGRLILNGSAVKRTVIGNTRVPISPNSPCRMVDGAVPTVVALGGRQACAYHALMETLP